MKEQTLSIIKPDATKRSITGKINSFIEEAGLRIVAQKRIHLNIKEAEKFYSIHEQKPFFRDLVNFMTSGPVVVQVLQAENAVTLYRNIMGATKRFSEIYLQSLSEKLSGKITFSVCSRII